MVSKFNPDTFCYIFITCRKGRKRKKKSCTMQYQQRRDQDALIAASLIPKWCIPVHSVSYTCSVPFVQKHLLLG